MNSFAGIFGLVLTQLQNWFFVEHLLVAAYVRCLKEKEWKKSNSVILSEADSEYVLFVKWRSRDSWRNGTLFMKYENMKEVSYGFCKKYKIPQKLVCVMITVNISCNLRSVGRSAVTNEFKTVPQYGSSVI